MPAFQARLLTRESDPMTGAVTLLFRCEQMHVELVRTTRSLAVGWCLAPRLPSELGSQTLRYIGKDATRQALSVINNPHIRPALEALREFEGAPLEAVAA